MLDVDIFRPFPRSSFAALPGPFSCWSSSFHSFSAATGFCRVRILTWCTWSIAALLCSDRRFRCPVIVGRASVRPQLGSSLLELYPHSISLAIRCRSYLASVQYGCRPIVLGPIRCRFGQGSPSSVSRVWSFSLPIRYRIAAILTYSRVTRTCEMSCNGHCVAKSGQIPGVVGKRSFEIACRAGFRSAPASRSHAAPAFVGCGMLALAAACQGVCCGGGVLFRISARGRSWQIACRLLPSAGALLERNSGGTLCPWVDCTPKR